MKQKIILIFLILVLIPNALAAHYIAGIVNDAYDGEAANDKTVVLWNPSNGINDNLTDIIGPNGNSGADNVYFIDCQALNTPCSVNDVMNIKVINTGDDYVTNTTSVTVTGSGFDEAPNLTLNSKPGVELITPENFANISGEVEFNCSVSDLDGNLANATLYGNWSGWHANETVSVAGFNDSAVFTKTLQEGFYKWNCVIKDDLSVETTANQNYTFTVDNTPPDINYVSPNITSLCGFANVRVNCSVADSLLDVNEVIIQAVKPNQTENYTASHLVDNTYYADIYMDVIGDTNFKCIANDTAGNANSLSSSILKIYSTLPDLFLSSSDIIFSNENPMENETIIINATILNLGCGNAENALAGFYKNDPDSESIQLNGNQTFDLAGLQNITINITWQADIGPNNIFVYSDFNNSITEYNETNNKANNSINVNAWQDFFGNVSIDKILADYNLKNMTFWLNESNIQGNIFIVDSESDINWLQLQPIGKNKSGANTTNDFSEIDSYLGMEAFQDSVSDKFTIDGIQPRLSKNFIIHQQIIENVPVINLTANSNFFTGILWDMSDDLDGEYGNEKEDIVFISEINRKKQGEYGFYDYELTIPARLRDYHADESSEVYLYYDLN